MVLGNGDMASLGLWRKSLASQSGFEGLLGEMCGLGRGSGPPGGWGSAETSSCRQGRNSGYELPAWSV